MKRHRYIAAYDIRNPRRLSRVLRSVRSRSAGGQKSVHECWLTCEETALLLRDIAAIIDEQEDSVVMVPVAAPVADARLGSAPVAVEPDFIYVG